MAVPLFTFLSPGAAQRTMSFERNRKKIMDVMEPSIVNNLFNLSRHTPSELSMAQGQAFRGQTPPGFQNIQRALSPAALAQGQAFQGQVQPGMQPPAPGILEGVVGEDFGGGTDQFAMVTPRMRAEEERRRENQRLQEIGQALQGTQMPFTSAGAYNAQSPYDADYPLLREVGDILKKRELLSEFWQRVGDREPTDEELSALQAQLPGGAETEGNVKAQGAVVSLPFLPERARRITEGVLTPEGIALTVGTAGLGGAGAAARGAAAGIAGATVAGEAAEQAGLPEEAQFGAELLGGVFPGTLALAGPRAAGRALGAAGKRGLRGLDVVAPPAKVAAAFDEGVEGLEEVADVTTPRRVAPLREFDSQVNEVDVAPESGFGKVASTLAAKIGVNPSLLMRSDVGKAVVARMRQKIAAEGLTSTALAPLNAMRQRFTGRMPFRIDVDARMELPGGQKVAWNDVFSTNKYDNLLSPEQREFISETRRVVEEAEAMRVEAGLKPRATQGKDADWWYVPRGKTHEVRGIATTGRPRPDLPRFHELAEEGIKAGVRYEQDPVAVLELHLKNAYDEVAEKQFGDWISERAVKPSTLIPEGLRTQMEDVTKRLAAAQRNRRALVVSKAMEREQPGIAKELRGRLAGRQFIPGKLTAAQRAADAELSVAKADFDRLKLRYKRAKDVALAKEYGPGSLFGRQEAEIPIAKWRNNFFTREDAALLEEWLGAFTKAPNGKAIFAQGFETLGNTVRFLSAVGDFAAPFIQGLPTLGRNPVAWTRATAKHYFAFLDPTVQARMIANDLETYQEMARYGVPVGDVEFFNALREGNMPAIGKFLNKLPKGESIRGVFQQAGKQSFGRFQSSYDVFLTGIRKELWKSMKPAWKGSLDDLATHVRDMTGALDSRALAVSPSQRGFEGTWMAFSPRLLRSTVALMSDTTRLLKNPTDPRGLAALRALGGLTAGAAGVYVATGLLMGKSEEEIRNGLNPLSGKKFLSHQINGDWIGIGGQVRAISQFMAQTGAAAYAASKGDTSKILSWDQNPLAQFVQGRGAPGLSIAQKTAEAVTGQNTAPYDKIDGFPDLILHIGESALPFAVQNVLEGQDPLTVGASVAGFRTSPETATETFKQAFEQKFGHEYGTQDLDSRLAINDMDLQPLYQQYRDSLGEFIPDIEKREEAKAAELENVGLLDALGEGQEAGFKQRYGEYMSATAAPAGEEFPEAKNPLLGEYWSLNPYDERFANTEDGTVNWELFSAEREKLREQMDEETLNKLYLPRFPVGHPAHEREKEMLEAERIYDGLSNVQKWEGLSLAAERVIKAFRAKIEAERPRWEAAGLEYQQAEEAIAQQWRSEERREAPAQWLVSWRRALDSSRDQPPLNDEYLSVLDRNRDLLSIWYPSLYEARYVREALTAGSR